MENLRVYHTPRFPFVAKLKNFFQEIMKPWTELCFAKFKLVCAKKESHV